MIAFFDFLWQIAIEIGTVFYEGSVFILVGFAFAGILHEFVPIKLVAEKLGKPGFGSIFWATALGAPLPLCSCGVLPTAATLRRKGASKPAVASFIVSVPETGVDSIAVSYGLMGPIMAVYRPIVAIFTAVVAGIACLFITRNEPDTRDIDGLKELEEHDHAHDHNHSHDHDHPHSKPKNSKQKSRPGSRRANRRRGMFGRMAKYGFRTILDEVAFWIVAGLVVTGILLAALPDDFFSSKLNLDSGIAPMILMAVIGVPLYTCASMSTPIAAGLIVAGLSPGAALVFLLAGPATSIASLSIVGKLLGRNSMAAYLTSILVVAIAAGLLLDMIAADSIRAATKRTFDAPDGPAEQALKLLSAITFVGLFIGSMVRRSYREPLSDISKQGKLLWSGIWHVRKVGYGLLVATLIVATVPAVTLQVGPGQHGMIKRFGEVLERDLKPGLHLHFPWPIDEPILVDTGRVRGTYVSAMTQEYLTSDENILALTSIIQYRIDDAYEFAFSGEKEVDLLRDLASRILVQEMLSRPIDEIYTVKRSAIEEAFRLRLAEDFEALGQGFELVEARLEHVHAPEAVHDSFRDVSSALEDRQRATFDADGRAVSSVTDARGRYAEAVALATGEATSQVTLAQGRAAAFIPQSEVYRQHPAVGQVRMRLEAIERSLVRPRKYLNTVPGSKGIDLWIDPAQQDVIKFNYRD